jgi:hypothetical protein
MPVLSSYLQKLINRLYYAVCFNPKKLYRKIPEMFAKTQMQEIQNKKSRGYTKYEIYEHYKSQEIKLPNLA